MTEPAAAKTVKVLSFSRFPGGRTGVDNGREFRERFLEPAVKEAQQITVDFIGAVMIIPSFVDEALGPFVTKLGPAEFRRRFRWVVDPETDVEKFIETTIAKRS